MAVNEARGPGWYTFDGPLVAFLAAILGGKTEVPLFGVDFLGDGATFSRSGAVSHEHRPSGSGPANEAADSADGHGWVGDSRVIRAWARANGHDLPDRGRIPAAIIDAWRETG